MNKVTLKSALKFWQEIVFMSFFGYLLGYTALNFSVIFQHTEGIVLSCLLLSIFIVMLGQLFWKNSILGIILAPVLGFAFAFLALAWLFEGHENQAIVKTIFVLSLFVGLTITAISMFRKYIS